MRPLHIRRATVSEQAELESLQRRASLALCEYSEQIEAHPDASAVPVQAIRSGEVLVAETGSSILGFAVVLETDGRAELDGLFVEPRCWRQGVGSALVKAATHEARRRGLSLMTVVANPSAQLFYERCGFSVEGEAATRFGPALRMSR